METKFNELFNEVYNSISNEKSCEDFGKKFFELYEKFCCLDCLFNSLPNSEEDKLKIMNIYLKHPNMYVFNILIKIEARPHEYETIINILEENNYDTNIYYFYQTIIKYFGIGDELYELIELYTKNKDVLEIYDLRCLLYHYLGSDKINKDVKECPKYRYNSMCENLVEMCEELKQKNKELKLKI